MDFQDIIVGGGASGTACAIMLARKGRRVAVLEAQDRILKKVLASGNGRCNLSNVGISPDRYNAPLFVAPSLKAFGVKELAEFFMSAGLELREEEGRIYPYSLSANNVVSAMVRTAKEVGVKIFCNERVEKIQKKGRFEISTSDNKFICDNLIFSAGSNATSGYDSLNLLAWTEHKSSRKFASITYLPCRSVKGASGVRARARLVLLSDGKEIFDGQGELLFKDNALSGILAFEASSRYARALRADRTCSGFIDFVPDKKTEEIASFFSGIDCDCVDALCAYLHRALAVAVSKKAEIRGKACDNALNIATALKHYDLEFDGSCDIKNAQVVCGGLELDGFDPLTLASFNTEGLYVTGEALDVDGDCGGFNLHWAWASAHAVANAVSGGGKC